MKRILTILLLFSGIASGQTIKVPFKQIRSLQDTLNSHWTAINARQLTLSGTGIVTSTAGTISYKTGTANQLLRRNAANTDYEFFTPSYLTSDAAYTRQIIKTSGFGGANTVQSADTRGVSTTPAQYSAIPALHGGVTNEFKNASDVSLTNTSGYLYLQTFTQYSSGGGGVHQIAFNDEDGPYYRNAPAASSVWNPWSRILTGNGGIVNQYSSPQLNANFMIAGTGAAARLIAGADNGLSTMSTSAVWTNTMTLGSAAGSAFSITGQNGVTGLFFGVSGSTGNTWMQAGLSNGNTYAFDICMQESGGMVGIGTGTPFEKLHVVGNVRISGLAGVGKRHVVANADGKLIIADDVAAGTYTPTITGSGTFTPAGFKYIRQGNIVSVDGRISCSGLGALTVTINCTLPIASNLTAAEDLIGIVSGVGIAAAPNHAVADTGADNALITFAPPGSSATIYIHFSYEIK